MFTLATPDNPTDRWVCSECGSIHPMARQDCSCGCGCNEQQSQQAPIADQTTALIIELELILESDECTLSDYRREHALEALRKAGRNG